MSHNSSISGMREPVQAIDRNCNVLPLSLDDLLNFATLMLKFCINKLIGALPFLSSRVQTGTKVWYKNPCPWTGPHVSTCKQNIHIANILLHHIFIGIQQYKKNVWRRNWYSLHTYIKTQYKPKIPHTQDLSLLSNDPNAIVSVTAIPPDKPFSQAPARVSMGFPVPPSLCWGFVIVPILM